MSKKDDLVSNVIDREWDMFRHVENIGGKEIVIFKSTPLIIGNGVLDIPEMQVTH